MKQKHSLPASLGFLSAFALWTAALRIVDVQPIGPLGSTVGFATLNQAFHRLTGVHMWLYTLTDWLSLVPGCVVLGFGLLGLLQWIGRKQLFRVDFSILALGGFYLAVLGVFLLFEMVPINIRPILIQGQPETSYPSSTTMLVLSVMSTARLQLRSRIPRPALRRWVCAAITVFSVFMVAGRLVSGVHWLTDIVGGILLSDGLTALYRWVCSRKNTEFPNSP